MSERNIYRQRKSLLSMAVLLFAMSNLIYAQPDSLERRPSVGDHVFTPVTYSNLPFTNTYFSTIMGFGQTTDLVHKLDLIEGVDLRGLQGELTFLDFGFHYQQRVRDWLGAYVKLNISARVGTELQSILSQGINTINSFNIGWHIRLVEREKIVLSTFAELQNFQGSFISVTGFVKDILAGVPEPSLTQYVPVLSGASGFRIAYGINDLIGLKLSTDLVYGESFERGVNKFTYTAGGGIDFDFFPRYNVPLGLVLNYSISNHASIVVTTDKNAQIFHGKIAYTGGQDFSLGIEYFYQKHPLPNVNDPPTVNAIALAARYYF